MQRKDLDIPAPTGREVVERIRILFDLIKDSEEVDIEIRQRIAFLLFEAYKNGTEDQTLVPDEERANLYLAIALGLTPPKDWNELFLSYCAWFTSLRLAGVRDNRFTTYGLHFHSLTEEPHGFFSTLQLSYGLELGACADILRQKSFRPETNDDRLNGKYWYHRFELKRVNQIFFSRGFANPFTNAFWWLPFTNFICYIWFPGLGLTVAVLNLIAFSFDIWHDTEFGMQELEEYTQFQDLSVPASRDVASPLNSNTKELLEVLGLTASADIIRDKVHEKIHGTKANYYTGIQWKLFRSRWVAYGLLLAMVLVYAPIIIPVLPTFLPSTISVLISPILLYMPTVSHFLASVGLLIKGFGHAELFRLIGIAMTIGFGVVWGSLGARLRGQIVWTNWDTTIESSKVLAKNILKYVLLCAAFYCAVSLIPLPAFILVPLLISVASLVPVISILRNKYQIEQAQKAAFAELPDNLPLPFIPVKVTRGTSYAQFSEQHINSGVLDIHAFSRLSTAEKKYI